MSLPAAKSDIGTPSLPHLPSPHPSNLKPQDWAKLSLATPITVKGHIQTRHTLSTNTWSTPTLTTNPLIPINGLSPALNYGQQCYEGLKAFRTPSNSITIFRPELHWSRLCRSAAALSLPAPSLPLFLSCLRQAVAANAEFVPPAASSAYLYIRPVLFGSSANLALAPPEESTLAVFVHPAMPYHGSEALDALVLEDFDRAAPRGMGGYKVGGNYAPVWRHAKKAREMGYGITLHLDSAGRGVVEEFSTSGFLGHRKEGERDVLVVPRASGAIVSTTSETMVRLAEREGWVVEREEVPFGTLEGLDEVVAVGTAAAAVPIRSVTRLSTEEKYVFENSDAKEGKLLGLARWMTQIQRGTAKDEEGWCWEVTGYDE